MQVDLPLNGPFDIIGDPHGCLNELKMLLARLGYLNGSAYYHPAGRTAVFLGDLADRGPHCLDSVRLVKGMVDTGSALYVPGNHCNKLARYLIGRNVQVAHGMEKTVEEYESLSSREKDSFTKLFLELYNAAPPYLILDNGNLVVVHGGIKEEMIGKVTNKIIDFCYYGDATGKTAKDGLPERRDWAQNYHGRPLIVYGHTPVPEPKFINNTIDIDQGCCMGGHLTALHYPELEIVQVKALDVYYVSPRFKPELITEPKNIPKWQQPVPSNAYFEHSEQWQKQLH